MAKSEYPSDKLDQYMVRFPEGMRDVLKEQAAQNNRSLNAEIVYRLDHYQIVESQPVIPSWLLDQLRNLAEDADRPLDEEVQRRLEFTLGFDTEFFDPNGGLAPTAPRSIEERISDIEHLVRQIAAKVGVADGAPSFEPDGTDDKPL